MLAFSKKSEVKMKYFWFVILTVISTFSLEACLPPAPFTLEEASIASLLKTHQIRLIVMRHGEAVHNLKHLMVSSKSPGIYLTEKGMAQVEDSAKNLHGERIDCIYVSPVYRTLQTAQLTAMELKIPYDRIFIDERLREQYFGSFEGSTSEEYIAHFSKREDVLVYAVPLGESGAEVLLRTEDFLRNIVSKHYNETILIVTHGFNCGHISKCIKGAYCFYPRVAEFQIFD